MFNHLKGMLSSLNRVFFFILIVSGPSLLLPSRLSGQGGGCTCTNCPQFMPDNFTGNFLIQVQNAANPTLGQNGQGVCGVVLNFDHEYIGDLRITLTSPGGQTVTLIGPIGLFGETDGSSWNITFLPCGDPVTPDPGFSDMWSNNQPWGLLGAYTGSYYPAVGCLENFNSGPVNGQWTLSVLDGQNNDVGNFYNYEIIFCDPAGILCFSCAASAGNLLQTDVIACEGDQSLDLDLPPTYIPQQPEAPVPDYAYTYVIGGAGGVILDYDPEADLRALPAGMYTVCGMSYLASQEGQIPAPNGTLTITQLTTQLNSSQPPFCGKITANCVNVLIKPLPPDVEDFETLCFPDCFTYYGQSFCQTGDHVVNLLQNGCPYKATLHLTVIPPSITNVTETICFNSCAETPGFESYCTQGIYQETFINPQNGCDSIVNLNLVVVSAVANIVPPQPITCAQPTTQLSGVGSSTGGTSYQWTASNGGVLTGSTTSLLATAAAAGTYQLRVCRFAAGITCCDSTSVDVISIQNPPAQPAGINGSAQVCQNQAFSFSVTPVAGVTNYQWTVPAGIMITSGQGTSSIQGTWTSASGGNVCVTTSNACGVSLPVCLTISVGQIPTAVVPQGPVLVCTGDTASYSIPAAPAGVTYAWTVPVGAVILTGQGSSAISLDWGTAGTGNVCLGLANACGPAIPSCLPVQVNSAPATPVVSGNVTACAGGLSTFSIAAVPGATSYLWTITGGVINTGQNTTSIDVTWNANGASGSVCATAVNNCGSSTPACLNVALSAAPAQPVIAGDATLCAGSNGSYSIPVIPGATGYLWTVPAGATIASGQNTTSITVNWTATPGGTVCAAAIGGCGTGPQGCFPVTVLALPQANAGVDGAVCGVMADLQASISVTGSTGAWVQVSGAGSATFVNPNAPATSVSVSQTGSYVFQWTETNGICSDADSTIVQFNASPIASLPVFICDGANQNFTVQLQISGGAPTYTVNGVAVAGNTFTSASFANGAPFSFILSDANNCMSGPVAGTHNCNCATSAGQMNTQIQEACEGQTITAVHIGGAVLDANDTIAFVLHTGSGAALGTVLSQNLTGIFGWQTGIIYDSTYYVSFVVGSNLNGQPDPNDPCLSVSVGQPVIFHQNPVAAAGLDIAVCGQTLTLNAGNPAGQWSVFNAPPGGNVTITDTQSPATTATATLPGAYTLNWLVTQNGCQDADQVTLQFNEIPTLLNLSRACDANNQNYTVTIELSGGTAPFLMNGIPFAGNTYTSPPLPNGQTYEYLATDSNGCAVDTITGSFNCNCSTDAGDMSPDTLIACENITVTAGAFANQVLDGNDVISFVMHTGAGPALGIVIDQNGTGEFAFLPGMTYGVPYYISVVAGNSVNGLPDPLDPCFSVAKGQVVLFLQNPVPNGGQDPVVCGTTLALDALPGSFNGQWSFVSGPGTAAFADESLPKSDVTVTQPGQYVFRWTETNGQCTAFDDVTALFYQAPSVQMLDKICNGTNTEYTLTFTVIDGTPLFNVLGLTGTFNGNTFTSDPLPNNSAYSFAIIDSKGCLSPAVTGSKNCNCATDAGSMVVAPLSFCGSEAATAVWNNDGSTDANDLVQFILHDQSGVSIGTIFAVSDQPVFNFSAALQTDVIYYISAIAGNNVNGNVDLTDPCLSVTPGVPVQWHALPAVSMTGDATICYGESAVLTFNASGALPLQVVFMSSDGGQNLLTVTSAQSATVTVTPASTLTYSLVSVSDGNQPACTVQLTGSATVSVNQPPNPGIPGLPPSVCAGEALLVSLNTLLTGADSGGQWTETSSIPSKPGAFNASAATFQTAGQLPGVYAFSYRVQGLTPCPDETATVTVLIEPTPVADAGVDAVLDCGNTSATLGGPATSPGPGVVYAWTLDGNPVPGAMGRTLEAAIGGVYQLTVSNTNGCTAFDAATVLVDPSSPEVNAITIQPVRCFGDANGSISIDSVENGQAPYAFALNDGPFMSVDHFQNLAAGPYVVTLMDARGCQWVSDTLWVTTPPEIKIDLGSDIQAALGDSVYLQLVTPVPANGLDTILWIPLYDTLAAGTLYQRFRPLNSGRIQVQITDENGCRANDEILVIVNKKRRVYIPNVFNPESDLNAVLYIQGGIDVVEIEDFRIFDRWGSQVFEATHFLPNDPAFGWTGNSQGEPAAPGVYVYYARIRFLDGERTVYSGDVTIIR